MKRLTTYMVLAMAGFVGSAWAETLLDTGMGAAYSARPGHDGIGQGVSVVADTVLTGFGFDFLMPEGGSAKFLIWDGANAELLFSETASVAASGTGEFRFTTGLGSFSLAAGNTYYFALIADSEINLGYFFPTLQLMQNGLALLEDGNANYADFLTPVATGDFGAATVALRLVGSQAVTESPEMATSVMLALGLALIACGRKGVRRVG